MHQQFTTALEGLTRQNTELQNELNQSRQGTRVCWESQATSPGRKTRGETGAQCFKGYAGAAIPLLQKLLDDAAKAAAPIPNATIIDD